MRKGWGVALLLAVCLTLTGCHRATRDSIKADAVFDTTLSAAISLDMKRSDVEKKLGDPSRDGSWYIYGGALYLTYSDSRVTSILLQTSDEGRWVTRDGIAVGSSKEKLAAAYGNPKAVTDLSPYGQGCDYTFRSLSRGKYTVRFVLSDSKVTVIYIQKA